ncbi:glycoside hydrolase family 26 protein [Streptomyces sp. QTS137]
MAPQHERVRVRGLVVGAVAIALSATLASGPAAGAASAGDPRVPAPEPTASAAAFPDLAQRPLPVPSVPVPSVPAPLIPRPSLPAPAVPGGVPPAAPVPGAQGPPFGAFLGSDERGVARIREFSRWLGGAELRVGHTYLPGNHWSDIEGDIGFLESWARWRNEKADRMLVLNVPLQERNEAGVPDHEVRELLRRGAAGEFDHHFRALAERLVRLKVPDTILVLGWEMNGITYTHRCGPDPEAWKTYWNRIVTTMRAVPGQKFRFDFTPSRGRDDVAWTECYPGDDTVDIIGMDSYDQPAGMPFDEQVEEPYGLQAHVDFAKAHGKPVSYAEWGLFHNGDNPDYMRRMLAWMDQHKPLYNTLSDYCPHGVWRCDGNPASSRVYRSVLFGRGTSVPPVLAPVPPVPPVPPTPSVPPVPAVPLPEEDCSPLDLGSRVEFWLGGKFCLRFDW